MTTLADSFTFGKRFMYQINVLTYSQTGLAVFGTLFLPRPRSQRVTGNKLAVAGEFVNGQIAVAGTALTVGQFCFVG